MIAGERTEAATASLDELDLKLIRILQDNPRAPYSTIARLSDVHESTVKRRIDDLLAREIILPAMIANIHQLGYRTRATIMLKVDVNCMSEVAERIRDFSETAYVSIAAGRYNVSCMVVVRTLEDLNTFLSDRIGPLPGVNDVEVVVNTRVLKAFANWRLPVDELLNEDTPPPPQHLPGDVTG